MHILTGQISVQGAQLRNNRQQQPQRMADASSSRHAMEDPLSLKELSLTDSPLADDNKNGHNSFVSTGEPGVLAC